MGVEPHVKGVSFRSVFRAIKRARGAQGLETCIASLEPQFVSALRYGTILASGWYPLGSYRRLLAAARTVVGGTDRAVLDLGRESAHEDLTTIYRIVLEPLSPQSALRVASRMFSNYYDTGTCTVLDTHDGFARVVWAGCTGFDHNMWLDVVGASESFLELSGAKHIRSRVVGGGGDRDHHLEATAHWL